MFEHILVPLDGTLVAEMALGPAVAIARGSGAHLSIVTVELPTPIDLPELPYQASVGDVPADYLSSVANRLVDAGVPAVTTKLLRGVDVVEELQAYGREVGVSLTVMCTHGRGPVRRAWMGSVADRLMRSSQWPVLLVRASEDPSTPVDLAGPDPFTHVLVTLDGSPLSEAAIGPATALGRGNGTRYVLARVIEPVHAMGHVWLPAAAEHTEDQIAEAREAAESQLTSIVERLMDEGFSVEGVAEFKQPVAMGILEMAEAHDASLIAIATHGYGGATRLALGSVADKVVRGADCPVLVVRPRDG